MRIFLKFIKNKKSRIKIRKLKLKKNEILNEKNNHSSYLEDYSKKQRAK